MKRGVWAALTALILFVGISMPAAAQSSIPLTPQVAFGVVHEEDGDLWVTVVNLSSTVRTFEIRRWNPEGIPGSDDESEYVWRGLVSPGWDDLKTIDVTDEGHQALQLWYGDSMLGTLSAEPMDEAVSDDVGVYMVFGTNGSPLEVHHDGMVVGIEDPAEEGTLFLGHEGAYVWYAFYEN